MIDPAAITRMRAMLNKAREWIANDETSGMGPAEYALRENLLERIDASLDETTDLEIPD